MLTQGDFLSMLGEMRAHMAKTLVTVEGLIAGTDDPDLRFKFIALKQLKLQHLESMQALTVMVREHSMGGADAPELVLGEGLKRNQTSGK